ncbi:MAG: efflux RND transporter permease subunit [Bacillota bacterium]
MDKKKIPELNDKQNFLGKWSDFFINRHRIVFLIILIILIWGISSYFQLPREVQPEIVIPYGMVTTQYNGASPKEVESLVTDEIESAIDDIDQVKSIASRSSYGVSFVSAEFEMDADMDDMLNKMRTKISDISDKLPDNANSPIISDFDSNNTPIMIINISGDYSLDILKNNAEDLKKELKKIDNISSIDIIGGVKKEIKIAVDPLKLSTYNLKLSDIENALKSSHLNYPGGNLTLDKKNYNIRTVGEFKTIKALEDVVLKNSDGVALKIKDVATLIDGFEEINSYSRLSKNLDTDKPVMQNSIALSIKKKDDGDITKISTAIKDKINNDNILPKDININISGDLAKYVEDQLGTVINNSKAGLFLVIIVLYLFIGFRESLIVSFVIPLSIFIAIGFMDVVDITFNTISLFALILAIGMLVDNGIVIMENVDRLRLLGLDSKLAAQTGTNQIAPAIMASTLTTIAAFFPIALTPGIMGEYIKQIPITVIFTLVASFMVAITITPTLSAYLLKKHPIVDKVKNKKKNWMKYVPVTFVFILALYAFKDQDTGIGFLSIFFATIFSIAMILKINYTKPLGEKDHFIIEKYGEILRSILKERKKKLLVVGLAFLLFVTSLSLIPLGILKVEMFTEEDYDRLYVNIETPKGATLEQTKDITLEVEKHLFKVNGIETFVSNIGKTGADSFEDFSAPNANTPNKAQIIIDLKEQKDRDLTSMTIADDLRKVVKKIPGADIEIEELQNGPPKTTPVNIRIIGNNLEELKNVASDFTEILKNIEGTEGVENSVSKGYPELQVVVDKVKASQYNLTEYDIAKQIRDNIYGIQATTFKQNQKEFDVIVKISKNEFKSIKDLNKIHFYNRLGQKISFNQVAELKETYGYTTIVHEDLNRQVTVSSNLKPNKTSKEIIQKFDQKIKDYNLDKNIEYKFGGETEEINENYTQMFLNMIIAAILVFLILAIQFNSLSQPFIILLTVPLSLIGVMFGLTITGNKFTFVAFVGVVSLVGIAVNDAIVLVDYINYLRKNGYSLNEAIVKTGKTRFLPVLATTITTAGGILPITLKQPFFSPLGYSIIFGLSMATVLTLVIIPIMYALLTSLKYKFKNKRKKVISNES